jgi:hypothetical protein
MRRDEAQARRSVRLEKAKEATVSAFIELPIIANEPRKLIAIRLDSKSRAVTDPLNNWNGAKRWNAWNDLNAKIDQLLVNERLAEEMRRRVSAAASSKDSQVVRA